MDILLSVIWNWGTWILALMGVWMSLNPPQREDQHVGRRWLAAFATVGLIVGGFQIWRDVRSQAAQDALVAKLTGADNYCYFQALFDKPQPNGGYEWQLVNKEKRPIPNVLVCLYRVIEGKDEFLRCWPQGMCIPHSVNQAKNEGPLMPGKHHFVFFGANTWEQTLEISGGKTPSQTGIINRDGREIWRFSDDAR